MQPVLKTPSSTTNPSLRAPPDGPALEDCSPTALERMVDSPMYHPSLFMRIVAPLLFIAPLTNVRLLHKIFVDDVTNKESWNMFLTKLNTQMQETSVLATVLLNANVGLLPKPSESGPLPQQYFGYMSLVASMASVVLALVFMRNSRSDDRSIPFSDANLDELRHDRHGLETLAILYSLPHAFLMWSLLLFSASFMVQGWYGVDTTARGCIGAFTVTVLALALWCTWTVRKTSNFEWLRFGLTGW